MSVPAKAFVGAADILDWLEQEHLKAYVELMQDGSGKLICPRPDQITMELKEGIVEKFHSTKWAITEAGLELRFERGWWL